jgi:hypothetical protein
MATEVVKPYYVGGADLLILRGSVTLTPALIAQATCAEQTLTVKGLKVGDAVFLTKPTAQAGLGIVGARVSAADTLAITYCNVPSGGNITPTGGEVYQITGFRFDTP